MDTGASYSFISSAWLENGTRKMHRDKGRVHYQWQYNRLDRPLPVVTADNSALSVHFECSGTVQIQNYRATVSAKVMKELLQGVDLILGMDWLQAHDVNLRCGPLVVEVPVRGKPRRLVSLTPSGYQPGMSVSAMGAAAMTAPLSAKQAGRALKAHGSVAWLSMVKAEKPDQVAPSEASSHLVPPELLQAKIKEYEDIFRDMPPKVPPVRGTWHTVSLEPGHTPPWRKQFRLTVDEEAEVKQQVTDLLAKGFIEPSNSPFGAPVLFVQKKDGTLRMCIDYRALNKITVRDRYPLPNIQDLIDKLHGCTVFSSLDLQSGYHQVRITDEDVPKTAFLTPMGQFQFKVLCFGLTNAPATFQRVMNSIFAPHLGKFVLVYLDDILVMSRTPAEHLEHLEVVFKLLRQHELYAKLKKCDFNKSELKFLGYIVGRDGVAMDPAKVAVITEWPVPTSVKELQSFLGLANYFRRFVPHYSSLAAPLTDLTAKETAVAFPWHAWPPAELAAFQELKLVLSSAPVLALPDLNGTFEVHTDASLHGTGGVLMQNDKVVAYTSSKFSSAEYNYTTGEQELLALIRALEDWRCYLEGSKAVTLVTDHHPLTYLQTQAHLSRRQARWVQFLSRFNFTIVYKPGVSNIADPISRNPALTAAPPPSGGLLPVAAVLATGCVQDVLLCQFGPPARRLCLMLSPFPEPLGALTRAQRRADEPPAESPQPVAPDASARRPRVRQPGGEERGATLPDPEPVQPAGPASVSPPTVLEDIVAAYSSDPSFAEDSDRIARMTRRDDGVWLFQGKVVVPSSPLVRRRVMAAHHDPAWCGHPGITKTTELVSRAFWWPTLKRDVDLFVKHCEACQRNKASSHKPYGLLRCLPVPGQPWESVSSDFIVKLPVTQSGHDSILVFVDRLTKMAHFVPTTESLDAMGFAELFAKHVLAAHGMPETLVSDRGPQYNNKFWQRLAHRWGVERRMSSAYHPQTDGQTERVNRRIEEMLRMYIKPDQSDWDEHLPMLEFAYNNSWQEAVQATPFYLNHGRHPRLPCFGDQLLPMPGKVPAVPTADGMAEKMKAVWAEAQRCMQAAQGKYTRLANAKRRDVTYQVGQQVLLSTKNLTLPGVRKLQPRYIGPFTISELAGPVACKLALPPEWSRVHDVFHVSLLKPYSGSAQGVKPGPPPLQWLEGEPLYKVDKLLAHRLVKKRRGGRGKRYQEKLEYLVHWEGYSAEHDSWEPRENLLTCDELIKEYNQAHGLDTVLTDVDSE